jgi:hypothetical protein
VAFIWFHPILLFIAKKKKSLTLTLQVFRNSPLGSSLNNSSIDLLCSIAVETKDPKYIHAIFSKLPEKSSHKEKIIKSVLLIAEKNNDLYDTAWVIENCKDEDTKEKATNLRKKLLYYSTFPYN